MKKYTKATAALLAASMLLSMAACSKKVDEEPEDETTATTVETTAETTATPTPRPTRVPTPRPTSAPTATPTPSPTPVPFDPIEFPDGMDLIPTYSDEEMYGDAEFMETRGLRMSEVTAENYPELKEALDALDLSSDQRVYTRRADSEIFSFLCKSGSSVEGYNFVSSTGERLMTEDVFSDVSALSDILGVSTDDLSNDNCAFVIEPLGVTFVFGENSNEREYKTVLYKGNEDIFATGDFFDMSTYAMEFRELWGSEFEYTVDIGNDGTADTISCTVDWDSGLSVSVNGNESLVVEEATGDFSIFAKYICKDGDCYLLCFLCGDNGWGSTYVFELDGDAVTYMGSTEGEITGAPVALPNHNEELAFETSVTDSGLTDPSHMYVSRITNLFGTYYTYYPISLESFPDTEREFGVGCAWRMLTARCDIEAEDLDTGASVVLPEGTQLRIALINASEGTVVLQDISDGTCYVITVDDVDEWNRTVDGVDEYELFSGIYYSG